MLKLRLTALTLLLVGCGIPGPIDGMSEVDQSEVAVVVVNGGVDDVTLMVERPGGERDAVPTQPCSAQSHLVPTNRSWRLEVGEIAALTLQEVTILVGVPFTVYRVTVMPDGRVDIAGPGAADRMPDVPIRFRCADE